MTLTIMHKLPKTDHDRNVKWQEKRQSISIAGQEGDFVELIEALTAKTASGMPLPPQHFNKTMRRFARLGLPFLSKSQVLNVYDQLCDEDWIEFAPEVRTLLQTKPVRSQAGVTVVTVLTKPYPCPGKCVFCPTDVRMPKSYLHDEPGAQRAERYAFDPFEQTNGRLQALTQIGHPIDKIELLILGGTWSSYKRDYQEWFVKRCFDAMNGEESDNLTAAQNLNVTANSRNVGLVVETRQDAINADELRWFRRLGVTKVQIGIQSMDERVLALNERGHDTQSTRKAFRLLRLAGYKIHAHWMPNLLGAAPDGDVIDYGRLWKDTAVRPDELKIYPTMLLKNSGLYTHWLCGEYKPYSETEVIDVLVRSKVQTPRYARLTRIIRDIPTTNVVEGFKKANLRQIAQQKMAKEGLFCQCIRCREVKREKINPNQLQLMVDTYKTDATTEHFLSFETEEGKIAGFLRLSFPHSDADLPIPELASHAMIREVHIYGPALAIGHNSAGDAQHAGLGTQLVNKAKIMAHDAGYRKIAVISAVGTRNYYRKHAFNLDIEGLYMTAVIAIKK